MEQDIVISVPVRSAIGSFGGSLKEGSITAGNTPGVNAGAAIALCLERVRA